MRLFTIGFTQTTAESFFTRLRQARVRTVLDVRLNNVSQLAGFAKKGDLPFFLAELGGMGYEHRPDLAPTQAIIDAYRKRRTGWEEFERAFVALMRRRGVARDADRAAFADACLLCSEHEATHCHRRLVAEHLAERWGDLEIVHL
jgi:uncharacterized protein (DUF488 family)